MADLMTVAQFKKKSGKFMARRKNPLILDIDKLLEMYPQAQSNPRRRLKILVLLYIWSKQYLANGGTRSGVGELSEQVGKELGSGAHEMTVTLSNQGARWKNGRMQLPGDMTGQSMGSGYRMEPFLPGKGKVGGVALSASHKRINTPALRAIFEDQIESGFNESGNDQYTMKQVIQEAETALQTAPVRELLDVYFEFTQSPAYSTRQQFEYADKDSRSTYRVHLNHQDGKFYKDETFQDPYTTDITGKQPDNWAMYAVDLGGRLYCKHSTLAPDGSFNHSSFMSGQPVICAGALECDGGGRLRYVSNESGHYRPNPGDLGHLLAIWSDDYNVDMTRVEVVISTGSKVKLNGAQALGVYRNYPKSKLNDF